MRELRRGEAALRDAGGAVVWWRVGRLLSRATAKARSMARVHRDAYVPEQHVRRGVQPDDGSMHLARGGARRQDRAKVCTLQTVKEDTVFVSFLDI